ncbi:uncharacterized protein M6B38_299930 [Iris pallida]|uniref:DUF868 domain-containing protein n=1 Tax=Iris pallida TaxID=29817 RepID=A0AAX6HR61_IRIPA|nr:uncharacterized protein M6B38_299930 [Iris pallida]
MQDPFPIPSCFSAATATSPDRDPAPAFASNKLGQSAVASVYRTKIAGHSRLITVTWTCTSLLARALRVSVEGADNATNTCQIELRPWNFWRRTGSKKLNVQGGPVRVFWDLRNAKFCGEPEPRTGYYVALAHDAELVLLLGDLKPDACRRTGLRPSAIEPALASKKEHVYGRRRFATRSKFDDKGRLHDISIECCGGGGGGGGGGAASTTTDPEMVVKIDGSVAVRVKHLQWKFRGNETVMVSKSRVEVFWDVHDWLFAPAAGLRHALFIFKPLPAPHSSVLSSSSSTLPTLSNNVGVGLFLYAWKLE